MAGNWSKAGVTSVLSVCLTMACTAGIAQAGNRCPRSPNGKYQATSVRDDEGGAHYQVTEIGREQAVLMTTHAQYQSPNDVKACSFSADSAKFAAAYHYGHEGNYTWVGVWSLPDGKFLRPDRLKGWEIMIPDSIFEGDGK